MKKTTKKSSTVKVKGANLVAKVKAIIQKGNAKKITIKDKKGKTLLELPLTLGLAGAMIAHPLAVVGAIAAFVTECSVTVDKRA